MMTTNIDVHQTWLPSPFSRIASEAETRALSRLSHCHLWSSWSSSSPSWSSWSPSWSSRLYWHCHPWWEPRPRHLRQQRSWSFAPHCSTLNRDDDDVDDFDESQDDVDDDDDDDVESHDDDDDDINDDIDDDDNDVDDDDDWYQPNRWPKSWWWHEWW